MLRCESGRIRQRGECPGAGQKRDSQEQVVKRRTKIRSEAEDPELLTHRKNDNTFEYLSHVVLLLSE